MIRASLSIRVILSALGPSAAPGSGPGAMDVLTRNVLTRNVLTREELRRLFEPELTAADRAYAD